jgi:CheY-like chemotaxis protein
MLPAGKNRALPFVLLIDDDLVSREVMATVLTMRGFTVHTAEDGAASLQSLADKKFVPGLILMDTQMPGLNGASLVEALRTRTRAPIVAISASVPPPALSAACDAFLLKPFGAEELIALLNRREANNATSASQQVKERESIPGEASEPVLSAAAGSPAAVLNAQTLAELRLLMPDTAIRQIYAALIKDLTERQMALQAAFTKGDKAEVRRIGHAIKGGCAMAGAAEAARLGTKIESGILDDQDNQLDNSSRTLSDLGIAVANLKRMLDCEFPT